MAAPFQTEPVRWAPAWVRRCAAVLPDLEKSTFHQCKSARRKRYIACDELFHWVGKPPALPVEVPRKKALASSIERSELLTANYQ